MKQRATAFTVASRGFESLQGRHILKLKEALTELWYRVYSLNGTNSILAVFVDFVS